MRKQAVCRGVYQQVRIMTKTENIITREGKHMVFITHFQIKEIFVGASFPTGS